MQLKRFFIYSVAGILLITSVAKMISSGGDAKVLRVLDPIFSISFRAEFWIVGGVELSLAILLFKLKSIPLRVGLITWLGTMFLLYRLGLILINYQKPCTCLGTLTASLHISPSFADNVMRIIVCYMLLGGTTILFWDWKFRVKKV